MESTPANTDPASPIFSTVDVEAAEGSGAGVRASAPKSHDLPSSPTESPPEQIIKTTEPSVAQHEQVPNKPKEWIALAI